MPALCLGLMSLPDFAMAQEAAPAQAPAAPQQTAPAGKKPAEPDYPDPRTFSVELYYWRTMPGTGPDIRGGKQATGYSSIFAIGKDKGGPGIDISLPITRTGVLHFDGFLTKGDGNQIAPADTTVFGTSFTKGDYLSTQYQIESGRLYLDDLLYPHKFPVAKLRFKSIWAIRYLRAKSTIDAPLSTVTTGTTASSNRQVILPEFGLAAEYALTPHVLFRVDGSGFGIPHKSFIWDGAATLSYRHGQWSVEGGYKALGFKTSPNKDEYVRDTLAGGFVGIRYYWK
ncbi:MAG: hypothetical protein ABUS49_06085 [Acidobacteriota bacterium]